MTTRTLAEAQAKLPELIDQLDAGEELLITRDARPVARLVRPAAESTQPLFEGPGALPPHSTGGRV